MGKSLLEGRNLVFTFQRRPMPKRAPRPSPRPRIKPPPKPKSLYFYLIGYGSYEDSGQVMLSHEKKFTKKRLRDMCMEMAPRAAKKFISGRKPKCLGGVCMYGSRKLEDIRFSEFYLFIAEQLSIRKGFKVVEPCENFFMFGWPNIMDPKDWESQREKDMDVMRKVIEDGLKK